MVKAIIFDMGGVALRHSYESVSEYLGKPFGINPKEAKKLYEAIREDWQLGKINIEKAANHFIKSLSTSTVPSEIIKEWITLHKGGLDFNKDVLALIKKLREKYKVYLLTNTMDLHFNVIDSTGFSKYFDKVYTSYKVGKRKPNSDFYQHLLDDVNLNPQECIFIDDKQENVKAAKRLKIKAILFKDYKNLLVSLKKLKITF